MVMKVQVLGAFVASACNPRESFVLRKAAQVRLLSTIAGVRSAKNFCHWHAVQIGRARCNGHSRRALEICATRRGETTARLATRKSSPKGLSLKSGTSKKSERSKRRAEKRKYSPRSLEVALEQLESGAVLNGVVVSLHESSKPSRAPYCFVDVGAFRISSQKLGGKPVAVHARLKLGARRVKVGQKLDVVIERVQTSSARLEVSLPARTQTTSSKLSDTLQRPLTKNLSDLKPGDAISGKIVALVKSGVLLDAGVYRSPAAPKDTGELSQKQGIFAFLRRRDFAANVASGRDTIRSARASTLLKVGDEIQVYVRRVALANAQIAVTMRQEDVTEEAHAERLAARREYAKRTKLSALKFGQELQGIVVSGVKWPVRTFGVYVDVNARRDGLIHVNNMPRSMWGEAWKDILVYGEKVHVSVERVHKEGRAQLLGLKLIGTQQQLEEQLLEEARFRVGLGTTSVFRKKKLSMSPLVESRVRFNMDPELRAELESLERSDAFRATARSYTLRTVDVKTSQSLQSVDNSSDVPADDDDGDDDAFDDAFDDDYFEDKYG